MSNCPNCGAPITSSQCEYCGTVFPGYSSYTLREKMDRCEQRRRYLERELAARKCQMYIDTDNMKRLYEKVLMAMRKYSGSE